MIRLGLLIAAFSVLASCATPSATSTDTPSAATPPVAQANPPASTPAPTPSTPATPASLSGAAILQDKCSSCHAADVVASSRKTRADWEMTVDSMIGNGANLSDAEYKALIDYLFANYGAR